MTTPETPSVELEPLVLSFDEPAAASGENRISETDIRELSAYNFDSDEETLAGIGSAESEEASLIGPFDISDRTLVGIGPVDGEDAEKLELVESVEVTESVAPPESVERIDRLEFCELEMQAFRLAEIEPVPASVAMPLSEPPGPFVSSDDDHLAPLQLPMKRSGTWLLVLPAALVAVAAVAVGRDVARRGSVPSMHSAIAQQLVAAARNESEARFEKAFAISAEAAAVSLMPPPKDTPRADTEPADTERANTEPAHTERADTQRAMAPAPREKSIEPAARRSTAKSATTDALGAVDLSANPPSNVVIDGRPLGKTPRVVQLSSGLHTVMFVHPERGRMSVTVNVRAGRTTSASADF